MVHLGQGLQELDAEFISEPSSLVLCNDTFVDPIEFVTDGSLVRALGSMLFGVGVPRANIWARQANRHRSRSGHLLLDDRWSVTS